MISSADTFVRLRSSTVLDEYLRAAHEEAPTHIWLEIIERFPDLREWVAHNKTVPVDVLEVLAADADAKVRSRVAMKRKLPEPLQLKLATDPDDGVRDRIAWNPKATEAVLRTLLDDPEPRIREQARARLIG